MVRTKHVTYSDDEGVEHEIELPAHWVICSRCSGEGHTSLHLGAFTREQLDEDPDFTEDYMAGNYDKPCEACGGSGKVQEIDRDSCVSVEQQVALKWLDEYEQAKWESFRERKHESLMLGESSLADWDGVEPW